MTTPVSEEDQRFVKQFVFPLTMEDRDGVGILGTGALLDVDGKTFLVTASHVLREFTENAEKIGIPIEPRSVRKVEVFTLGELDLWLPPAGREDMFDVAVAQIRNSSAVERLRYWPHLKRDFFGPVLKKTVIFLMAGYPGFLSQPEQNHLRSGIFYAAMPPYKKPISLLNEKIESGDIRGAELIDPRVDLLFAYPEAFIRPDGTRISNFSFRGISGAPVWGVRPTPLHLPPHDRLQLVGFETAVVAGEFIRAKRSESILKTCRIIEGKQASGIEPSKT